MRAKIDPIGLAVLVTYDDREPTVYDSDLIIGAIHFKREDIELALTSMAALVHCINHNPGFFPRPRVDNGREEKK